MKIRHMVAAMALAIPGFLSARPADPTPVKIANPDGSVVTVRMHGNEFFHFMTDEGCTRILERDSRGYIADMLRDGAPVAYSEANVRMLSEEAKAQYPDVPLEVTPQGLQKMATLDKEGRSNYPTIGKGIRSLVVLVEFNDVQFTMENPQDYYTRQLNEPGFSEYGAVGSALDYYKAASNGLYEPQFDVFGPVKINRDASYYYSPGSPKVTTMISESLKELHDQGEIDFSNYDYDNDGIVDTIFFYYAGYGMADSGTQTIWPHQYDYRYLNVRGQRLTFDGKEIGPYACTNELKGRNPQTGRYPWQDGSEPWVDGIGAFTHEYGHVLGLPDLYDVQYSGQAITPGQWSVMDSGCYNFESCIPLLYSAYEQWLCRWLEVTDVEDGESYDINALGTPGANALRIRIPKNEEGDSFEDEYYIIEARDASGWDRCFPESGIMIWRINYNYNTWATNNVNSRVASNVMIHCPQGQDNPVFTKGAIYPGSSLELTPSTKYEFWESPIISAMSYDAEAKTGHLDYNVISGIPTGAPLLHDTPIADENGARNFTVAWDEVEDADSYQITIKRVSNGNVLGIYEEFNVGNVTSFKVVSAPISFWNNEIEVYVRAVKVIPCSDTSNVVRFVPKDLPTMAVDGIEAEGAVISGGEGCINAPEGAQVFDMAGKSLAKEGLAPGVYIVVYGARTEKVVVH